MTLTEQVNKHYLKVDKIAKKGPDGFLDYFEYIDGLLDNGEYYIFEELMLKKYKIDVTTYQTVDDVKKKTFDLVRLKTTTRFQDDLKKLYDINNIYQIGLNIYDGASNAILGQFKQIEGIPLTFEGYEDYKFMEREKTRVIFLEVWINNTLNTTLNDTNTKLIDKYTQGIKILKGTVISL